MRIEVSKEWAAGVDGVAGYIRYIPHQRGASPGDSGPVPDRPSAP